MNEAGVAGGNRVESLLSLMTLEEKAGQMVMAGFPGKLPGAEVRTLIEERHVGGVILFSRNLSDPFQTAFLVNELQKMAASSGAGIPLLVAADQEGGYVARLPGAPPFPGNMGLGASADPQLALEVARATARQLRACGINMNFAPVVDVNSNPDNPVIGVRSFGESVEAVCSLGAAMVRGFQQEGVSATAKHFPGHGDTSLDSHIDLPTVPHGRERLEAVELRPFHAAIDAGVDAVMTAHVTFPAVEPKPGLPATLSRAVLTGLLRDEMGFDGLIVTDAMEMGAIVRNFGLEEAAVMAVNAGADMVLVGWPKDWRDAVRVADALVSASRSGEIPTWRVDESVRRILSIKERRGILQLPQVDASEARELVGADAHRDLAIEAARRAICLVRDTRGLIPLNARSAGRVLVVFPEVGSLTQVEEGTGERASLAHSLGKVIRGVDEVAMPTNPDAVQREEIVAKALGYDTVVVLTYRAWSSAGAGQAALVSSIAAKHHRVIAVALREPYDLARYDNVGTYLAAFGASGPTLEAIAEVLLGRVVPTGSLPVQIPGVYQAGHRLQTIM